MRGENLAPDATNDQVLFAPVELEGFAQFEVERDEGLADRRAAVGPPAPDELGDPAVGARESGRLQFTKQLQRGAPIPLGAAGIRFQCLDEARRIRRYLDVRVLPFVLRLGPFRCPQPTLDGVTAIPRLPRNLGQRHAIPVKQPPNPSQILHGDHLLKSCSKNERDELITLVNFQRAQPRFSGQFSTSVNTPGGTVVIFQVRTQLLQVEATVNRPQQVIDRNMILKFEAVEQSILIALLLPHHLGYPLASMRMAYYTTGVFQQHRCEGDVGLEKPTVSSGHVSAGQFRHERQSQAR